MRYRDTWDTWNVALGILGTKIKVRQNTVTATDYDCVLDDSIEGCSISDITI